MPKYEVTISDVEDKALRHHVVDPQVFLQNFIDNKCRKCVDRVVENETSYNPKKTDTETKLGIVRDTPLKTRVEINAEKMAELTKKE